ncbi:hypothetical protein M9H77_22547 [Catharanthus roseus]|uniref:Uncharacterized protein n=1 Tax=Catharanthus roseus TaxID=4058 RepID=A0ACC0ASV9_CATRO|nr:hypothetical protein M9H77_22547 [Catharanthus roseus]
MSASLKNKRVKKKSKEKKEIVVLEKSEEVNFYANETNFFFASESLCVQNFEDSSKNEGGKLAYKPIKTINFFLSNSYLSFEIDFKEIKLFSLSSLIKWFSKRKSDQPSIDFDTIRVDFPIRTLGGRGGVVGWPVFYLGSDSST